MNTKHLIEITNANFDEQVLAGDVPVLIDFWAPWCAPCRAVGPRIEKLAVDFANIAKVGKLNVDENPDAAQRFGISSIPAVLLFHRGQVIETFVGVRPQERYAKAIEDALSTS